MKKFVKVKHILARIPFSRAQIYKLMAAGKFPRQVKLGGFGSYWVEEEIDAWIQSHIDAADKQMGRSMSHLETVPDAA